MKNILRTLGTVFFLAVIITNMYLSINFNKLCGGYLERAAYANTIELAESQLDIALKYIEKNNLTSGYTSVLYKTPDEDLGYWYENIKKSNEELKALPATASSLEKSNMLIKLRESLVSHGRNGSHVITPKGISKYPNNPTWGFLTWAAIIVMVVIIFQFKYEYDV